MRRVVVNIDRLVLKGIRFEDRHAVAQELQEQLTRLLAAPGMAERMRRTGSAPRLRLDKIQATGNMQGQGIGRATGRAMAAHWSQEGRAAVPSVTDSAPGQRSST